MLLREGNDLFDEVALASHRQPDARQMVRLLGSQLPELPAPEVPAEVLDEHAFTICHGELEQEAVPRRPVGDESLGTDAPAVAALAGNQSAKHEVGSSSGLGSGAWEN